MNTNEEQRWWYENLPEEAGGKPREGPRPVPATAGREPAETAGGGEQPGPEPSPSAARKSC